MDTSFTDNHGVEGIDVLSVEDFLKSCNIFPEPPAPLFDPCNIDKARLIIQKIVIENFKSYGARKVLGPFHKNLTCIIGPNGSGKSNVIDSLLFVFGFRSARIRSKKIASLVHNSLLLPDVDHCSVDVYFAKIIDTGDGPEDYEIITDSQFVVTRKAFADNTSHYYINNSRTNIKDVGKILRQNGIDLDHNRFLILQGEVEQIAMMKPKAQNEHEDGFLEYLEDIIGSGRFKEPLTKLSARIERLKDIKLEKVSRLKVVEKEKKDLESIRNEAIQYLKLMNTITALKNKLYQICEHEESKKEKEIRTKLDELSESLKDSKENLRKLGLNYKEKHAELEKINAEKDEIDAVAVKMKEDLNIFNTEDAKIQDEAVHLRQNGKNTRKQLLLEEKKLEGFKDFPDTSNNRKAELLARITTLEENKKIQDDHLQEVMNNLEQETKPLRMKIEKMEIELRPLQQQADEAKSKFQISNQELELLLSARTRELNKAEIAKQEIIKIKNELAELECKETEVGDQKNLSVQINRTERDLKQLTNKEIQLTEELAKLKAQYTQLRSEQHIDDSSKHRVLDALLQACSSGQIKGIIGRLGDLGAIDKAYDVAISTCCGALDNIVTETIDDAQAAVDFLKRNNIGQATFIGLDKMAKFRDAVNAEFTLPDKETPRLYDLIQPVEERFKPAFYYALRDTLVAHSLEKARSIAFNGKQRFRVVSLKGELVEVSGAMSGGGTRCLSGRMCLNMKQAQQRMSNRKSNSRKSGTVNMDDKISRLEQDLKTRQNELTALVENRTKLEVVITRLKRQLRDADSIIRTCQQERPRLERAIQRFEHEIEAAESRAQQTGPSPTEQKKAEKAVQILKAESEKKIQKAQKLLQDFDVSKKELIKLGDERMDSAKSRVKAVADKLKEARNHLNKIEVELSSTERNETRCRDKIESLRNQLTQIKSRLDELQLEQTDLEIKSAEKLKEFEESKKLAAELDARRTILNEDFESINNAVNEKKAEHNRLSLNMDEAKREAELSQQKRQSWMNKIRSLRLNKLDDEDDFEVLDEKNLERSLMLVNEADSVQSENGEDHQTQNFSSLNVTLSSTKDNTTQSVRTQVSKYGLRIYTKEELEGAVVDPAKIEKLENHCNSMTVNMSAIATYRKKTEMYLSRVEELNNVRATLDNQQNQFEEFSRKRKDEFLTGFNQITRKLKEMYRMITIGGDAELEYIDSLDPFSEGVMFSVRPPNKSWKNISNLSGGEKTLSSLALVFALHHYRPSPLYVMDEIDAALDFKNVSIVGNYLKERTKNAQFIVISLRNNMYELADRLVGIFKLQNITYTVVVDPGYVEPHLQNAIDKVHPRAQKISSQCNKDRSTVSNLNNTSTTSLDFTVKSFAN